MILKLKEVDELLTKEAVKRCLQFFSNYISKNVIKLIPFIFIFNSDSCMRFK